MKVKIIYARPAWWHEGKANEIFDVHIITSDSAGIAAVHGFPIHELFFVPDKAEEYKRYIQTRTSGSFPSGRWIPMCDVLHVVEAPTPISVLGRMRSRSAIYDGRNVFIVSTETGNRLRIMKAGGKELMVEQSDPGLGLFDFKVEDVVDSLSNEPERIAITLPPGDEVMSLEDKNMLVSFLNIELKYQQSVREKYDVFPILKDGYHANVLFLDRIIKKIKAL